MSEDYKPVRLIKAAKEFNIGISTIVEFLSKKGFSIESKPNTKILPEMYVLLIQEFQSEKNVKEESQKIGLDFADRQTVSIDDTEIIHAEEDKEKAYPDRPPVFGAVEFAPAWTIFDPTFPLFRRTYLLRHDPSPFFRTILSTACSRTLHVNK